LEAETASSNSALTEENKITAHLPIGSLPGLYRTTETAFAATASPYLKANSLARERFSARYRENQPQNQPQRQTLIGIAWQTRNQETGRKRSIDLSLMAPLFALPGVRWISLQYGDFDTLEEQVRQAEAPVLVDRAVDQLSNIDIFAAQIAAMDQVITIDNSTAHLAGALGVPVWVLLPFAADWRWLKKRSDSPWYPTMRLFRQPQINDWKAVIQQVQQTLSDQLEENR
jgi:hypothetical protein